MRGKYLCTNGMTAALALVVPFDSHTESDREAMVQLSEGTANQNWHGLK